MDLHPTLALLAPVPLRHLQSGEAVCHKKGRVAFGSRAWELFRKLDAERGGMAVEVLFYASHADIRDSSASWRARYVRHVEGINGVHPDGRRYRPSSALDDTEGHWAVFWEVEDLQLLKEPIPIAELRSWSTGEPYGPGFVPEGPALIERS